MLYAQYCRIETKAGGVWCSRRQLIRAARTLLAPRSKTRELREARQKWLREALELHHEARELCRTFRI